MIRFTEQEILRLREKVKKHPEVIEQLKERCMPIFERPIDVPKKATGTWSGYFYCSEHSVPLIFDINSPHGHKCPVDGKIFSGEPYDGSWVARRSGMDAGTSTNMAYLYVLTGERKWADKAIALLEAYAEVYKDYEEHGDIPCNLPGKAFSQSITDSAFVHNFANTYDMLEHLMTKAQKEKMKEGLFFPAGDFLMEHRSDQLHNHEVVINAAIATIGVVFDRKDYIDFALYSKYGIIYQLEHGVLADGMWCEGSTGYHFFTLSHLLDYEKFARHTPYSIMSHPGILKMVHFALDILQPDDNYPVLNDGHKGKGGINGSRTMDYIYANTRDERVLKALNVFYRNHERDSLDIFLYCDDELPPDPTPDLPLEKKEYHNEDGSGLTIFRGDKERYLLVKHGPYGGEHDHFDRLGVSFMSHGKHVVYDIGTTGYGAKLHYQYYKNTATHNTVSIDGANQPPSGGFVNKFEHREDGVFLDCGTTWAKPYDRPNILSLVEWDEEIYKGTEMRRRLLWAERYWIDLFTVEGTAPERNIDYTLHFGGQRLTNLPEEKEHGPVNDTKPQCYLSDITVAEPVAPTGKGTQILYDCGDGVTAASYIFRGENQLFFAKGPDNPNVSKLDYQIERSTGGKGTFLTLTETYGEEGPLVKEVTAHTENGEVIVTVTTVNGEKKIHRMA